MARRKIIGLGRNCGQYFGSDRAATGVRAVAEMVAEWKLAKYSNLASNFTFQPIAVENLGAFSLSTLEFLSDLSHKLSSFPGEE